MSTGKYGSKDFGVLLVDGYDVLASKLQGFTRKIAAAMTRTDGLGDTVEAQSPTGVQTIAVTQTGAFFDDSTNGIHALLNAIANLAVSRLLVAAFYGNAIGKPFLGCSGVYGMTYEALANVGNLTKANVSYNVSGSIDRGVIVLAQGAQTVTWAGTAVDYTTDTSQQVIPITSNSQANPSVVTTSIPHGLTTGQVILIAGVVGSNADINGERAVTVISPTTFSVPVNATTSGGTGGTFVRSSTVNGGAGYQAVSQYAGLTGVIGKIQHSADNSSWVDLVTFTNVTTGPISERIAVAPGTTVNRYLKSIGTATGVGSITPFQGFSRA